MAPTAPKKRPSIRAKTSKTTPSLLATPHSASIPSSSLPTTKKDRRITKSATFLSRITKSHAAPLKRRRPSKKLQTTLSNLADALPDIDSLVSVSQSSKLGAGTGISKPRATSLKSRPGAQKRKTKLEALERDRFAKNLGVMMSAQREEINVDGKETEGVVVETKPKSRFAALREWAKQNVEKHPAFENAV